MAEPMDAEVLIDTSLLIDFFRRRDKADTALFGLLDRHRRVSVSVITVFEFEVGIQSERQRREYEQLTGPFDVLPIDEACTAEAVTIYRDLKRRNELIELADLLIAATARRYALPVATLNRQHFERVMSLRLIDL